METVSSVTDQFVTSPSLLANIDPDAVTHPDLRIELLGEPVDLGSKQYAGVHVKWGPPNLGTPIPISLVIRGGGGGGSISLVIWGRGGGGEHIPSDMGTGGGGGGSISLVIWGRGGGGGGSISLVIWGRGGGGGAYP